MSIQKASRLGELVSILAALVLAGAAAYFFWLMPGWQPLSDWPKYLLAWMAVAYLALQLVASLETAVSIRLTGIFDSVAAIVPLVVGLVVLVNVYQGMVRPSEYQWQALLLLLATAFLDFIVTMWIRFAINRRTLGLDLGTGPAG